MMSRELERKLAEATELAKRSQHEFVTLEHILLVLTESPVMSEILEACAVNVQKLLFVNRHIIVSLILI